MYPEDVHRFKTSISQSKNGNFGLRLQKKKRAPSPSPAPAARFSDYGLLVQWHSSSVQVTWPLLDAQAPKALMTFLQLAAPDVV